MVCTECKNDIVPVEGSCPCKVGEFKEDSVCKECFNACKTCTGTESNECVHPTDPNAKPI